MLSSKLLTGSESYQRTNARWRTSAAIFLKAATQQHRRDLKTATGNIGLEVATEVCSLANGAQLFHDLLLEHSGRTCYNSSTMCKVRLKASLAREGDNTRFICLLFMLCCVMSAKTYTFDQRRLGTLLAERGVRNVTCATPRGRWNMNIDRVSVHVLTRS
jgi:hypothetical protein